MMVKVCGITRREDAEAAVEAGASALGFVFFSKSPRCVTPEQAAELGAGLNVWKVGIFVDESSESVKETMHIAKLDVAQIYGGEVPPVSRVWQAFRAPLTSRDCKGADVEAVLLDGPSNGIGFDWNEARNGFLKEVEKVIVAGGLDASNVAEAIRIAKPWGVDASSKLESKPGIKDHEKVRQFVKAALAA